LGEGIARVEGRDHEGHDQRNEPAHVATMHEVRAWWQKVRRIGRIIPEVLDG
jgi:hypothetical protein